MDKIENRFIHELNNPLGLTWPPLKESQRALKVSGHGYQGVLATRELNFKTKLNKLRFTAVCNSQRCNDKALGRILWTSNMAKGRRFVPSKEKEGNWVSESWVDFWKTWNEQRVSTTRLVSQFHSSVSFWEVHWYMQRYGNASSMNQLRIEARYRFNQ